MADALDYAPLEESVRACLAQDEAIAGLVRAIGRDPAALDARAVRDIAAILRRLAASTPRYRCANCGFSSIDHFWQCPGCKNWDSQRPLLRFDLVAGLEGGQEVGIAPARAVPCVISPRTRAIAAQRACRALRA